MFRCFLFSCSVFFLVQSCYASIYCDGYGNCSGTNENGDRVNLYSDGYGNTTGTIGDNRVNLYNDG